MDINKNSIFSGDALKKDTINVVNATFSSNPSWRKILVNEQEIEVLFIEQDFNTVKLIFRPLTKYFIGDICIMNNAVWIMTQFIPHDIFPTAQIELSNFTCRIKVGERKSIQGHDKLNRPIMITSPIYEIHYGAVKNQLRNNNNAKDVVNLPVGQIEVTIPYKAGTQIKDGSEFEYFGRLYQVINVDYSNVYNDRGMLSLHAKRVVE